LSRGGCQNRRHLLRNWDHGDSTTSRFGRGGASGAMQVNRALAAEVLAHQHHPPDGLSQAPERRHRLASPELHPSPLPCPRERCRLLKPPALLPTPANGAGLNISGHEQTLHPVNLSRQKDTTPGNGAPQQLLDRSQRCMGAQPATTQALPRRRTIQSPTNATRAPLRNGSRQPQLARASRLSSAWSTAATAEPTSVPAPATMTPIQRRSTRQARHADSRGAPTPHSIHTTKARA
jgi:hypothetical protein